MTGGRSNRSPASRGTVLVVDDERVLRTMLRAMLEDLGFDVIQAADGEAGLEMLREHAQLRVLVLDMTMPRKGGLDVLETMAEEGIDLPTILCSGYQDPESAERFALRRLRFLQKPFGFEELAETLHALLAEDR